MKRNVSGIFAYNYDDQLVMGLVLISSGLLSYYTCEDYVEINGKKEKLDLQNEFFFIPMKIWGYGLTWLGILSIIGGVVETFFG